MKARFEEKGGDHLGFQLPHSGETEADIFAQNQRNYLHPKISLQSPDWRWEESNSVPLSLAGIS